MKIRNVVTVYVAAATLCLPAAMHAAAMKNMDAPVHAMISKSGEKTVKVTLRNDSGAPMELKIGDEIVKLDAGQTEPMKLAVGTRIVLNTATATKPAGTLIAEVSNVLKDATLMIK